jgi:hypothetical protein
MTTAAAVGRPSARAWRRALVAALALCAFGAVRIAPSHAAPTAIEAETSDEFTVKAAFLYNFALYVKWPKDAFPEEKAPLVVAVYGHDPFGHALEDALRGKTANDHPIQLVRIETLKDLRPCHMLYVPEEDRAQLAKLLEYYGDAPTLIVGESIDFAKAGGVIGFFSENRKTRFAINTAAVKRQHLEVSSQLLKLAKIVNDEAEDDPR